MKTESLYAVSGVILGLMIIVALLVRKDANRLANQLLAASLACSISYLTSMIVTNAQLFGESLTISLMGYAYFPSVPFLFGYVILMTRPSYRLGIRDCIHLVPVLIVYALLVLGLADGLHITPANLEKARSGWPPSPLSLVSIAVYLVPVLYLSRALTLIYSHQAKIADVFSHKKKITLRWLGVLIAIYLLLSVGGLGIALIRLLPGVELWPRSLYSMSMIIAIYYLIAFIGISQPAVFSRSIGESTSVPKTDHNVPVAVPWEADTPVSGPAPQARYETSALTESAAKAHWDTLRTIMSEQRPYLDNELRIAELAELADIPPHHLSQIINQHAGQRFFEFINRYRVEAAKTLLKQEQQSMTSITFEAGFNSQSAFYRQFKKVTGLTPKQYQRQNAASNL